MHKTCLNTNNLQTQKNRSKHKVGQKMHKIPAHLHIKTHVKGKARAQQINKISSIKTFKVALLDVYLLIYFFTL